MRKNVKNKNSQINVVKGTKKPLRNREVVKSLHPLIIGTNVTVIWGF